LTEKQKMVAGLPYDPYDPVLVADRILAREILQGLNACAPGDDAARRALTAELLGYETDAFLQAPFFCDYGYNLAVGEGFYCNFNCVILDVAPVRIGERVLLGPAVQIYTALHPLEAKERATGLESGKPVTIGSDVWIGGGSIMLPGVAIGDRAVIGAGSVVTKDIPAGVVAAGNPCRVLRPLFP
jgi:maltose O-acetyltransferase